MRFITFPPKAYSLDAFIVTQTAVWLCRRVKSRQPLVAIRAARPVPSGPPLTGELLPPDLHEGSGAHAPLLLRNVDNAVRLRVM